MKNLMPKDDYEAFSEALNTNKTGLDHLAEHVYGRMFGYKSSWDYHVGVSPDRFCENISIPTLSFESKDDFIFQHAAIPFDKIQQKGSQVFLASSQTGSHGTHLTGLLKPWLWAHIPCLEFLNFLDDKLKNKYAANSATNE